MTDDETTIRAQRIQARLATCNCGCRGTDPQHQKRYVRTVRRIRQEPRTLLGVSYEVTVGEVTLPGHDEAVRVTRFGPGRWWTNRATRELNGD